MCIQSVTILCADRTRKRGCNNGLGIVLGWFTNSYTHYLTGPLVRQLNFAYHIIYITLTLLSYFISVHVKASGL